MGISSAATTASTIAGPSQASASVMRRLQFAGLRRLEAVSAAGARERGEVGIGKFDAFAERRQPDRLRLQRDQPERGIVVDHHLDRQLVMHGGQEFAHQHVEAAVAAERDDLARAVQRLDAVGLAERGADRGVVERADDPLRAALADPVGRPQRVEPGIEDEDRVARGEIADRARHRLRMDAILAARRIGLPVQHLIPLAALLGHLVAERVSVLAATRSSSSFKVGRAEPTTPSAVGARRPSTCGRSSIWMTTRLCRQEFRIRIVGADHQQQVAMHHRVVDRPWCRSCRCRPSSADRHRA